MTEILLTTKDSSLLILKTSKPSPGLKALPYLNSPSWIISSLLFFKWQRSFWQPRIPPCLSSRRLNLLQDSRLYRISTHLHELSLLSCFSYDRDPAHNQGFLLAYPQDVQTFSRTQGSTISQHLGWVLATLRRRRYSWRQETSSCYGNRIPRAPDFR